MENFYFQKWLQQGHKSSYRQYDIFGAQNRQNDDKSSNLTAMYTAGSICDERLRKVITINEALTMNYYIH